MESVDNLTLFGLEIYDPKGFMELLLRFSFNLLIVFIIVRLLYYPLTRRKDYLFTYILIAVMTFLICFMLGNVKLQLGFALGLFAVFGIIRYRTNPMPIKEMTYLFVIIGVSVINALANKKTSYAELFFTNFIVVAIIYGLEKIWLLRHESCKIITYEKIDLIKPEKREELIADLEKRTGLKINRVEIGKINFMRDTVQISIYYYSDENTVDNYYADNDDDED
jgi:hypothetical protein